MEREKLQPILPCLILPPVRTLQTSLSVTFRGTTSSESLCKYWLITV
ncbi:hypothetical protein L195_g064415, partial [Trifolium pratense]